MPLYRITRTDDCRYDDFDGFVIRAVSPERALEVAQATAYLQNFRDDNTIITEINLDGVEEVILSSFIAG